MDIYVVTGFAGSGKTTFINRVLEQFDQHTAVIINDEGDEKLDEKFSQSLCVEYVLGGCICCTLIAKFRETVRRMASQVKPDRIIIEASGLGKVTDVIKAVDKLAGEGFDLNVRQIVTMVDVNEYTIFSRGLGDFYMDQIKNAGAVILTHGDELEDQSEMEDVIREIGSANSTAQIFRSISEFNRF